MPENAPESQSVWGSMSPYPERLCANPATCSGSPDGCQKLIAIYDYAMTSGDCLVTLIAKLVKVGGV